MWAELPSGTSERQNVGQVITHVTGSAWRARFEFALKMSFANMFFSPSGRQPTGGQHSRGTPGNKVSAESEGGERLGAGQVQLVRPPLPDQKTRGGMHRGAMSH